MLFLNNNNIKTLSELSQHNNDSLSQLTGFNEKIASELEEKLESLDLSFGMDINKYSIKKEIQNSFDLEAVKLK